MLIVVPAAWFGVSYYRGEDPVGTVKNWIGWEDTEVRPNYPDDAPDLSEEDDRPAEPIRELSPGEREDLLRRIERLEQRVRELERRQR